MARVVAFVPDLLFGSNLVGALRAAGHDPVLVSNPEPADFSGAEVLVVDLTSDAADRIELVRARRPPGVPTLAFYAHVETDVRLLAEAAGFDLVVPRSRLVRSAGSLVDGLLAADE